MGRRQELVDRLANSRSVEYWGESHSELLRSNTDQDLIPEAITASH